MNSTTININYHWKGYGSKMGCKEISTDLGIAGSEKYMGLSEHVVYHRMVVYGTLNEETDEQP
jgi:hypothetical protein